MKKWTTLAILLILPLLYTACNKDSEEIVEPDLPKNAITIDGVEYTLTQGIVQYSDESSYSLILYSKGISYDADEFGGKGDFIMIDLNFYSWEAPVSGTYSTYYEQEEAGSIREIISGIDFTVETWESAHFYSSFSATMELQKNGSNYEITIEGTGVEYRDDDPIKFGVQLKAYFKGTLTEYDFPTQDPSACHFDIDTVDFTFGIDHDHPEKYLVTGQQSDLSNTYLDEVRKAIGTPTADVDGIMKVCQWVNQNFQFENAGGAMIGVNAVDELFEIKTFYGCHSQALIISSILREFGFPSVMIETADIQWAYDHQTGSADFRKGHVMSEIFVNDKWILLDNNCTYVSNYDYTNPFIPVLNTQEKGWFVFGKGVDTWDYRNGNESFTNDNMDSFSANLHCYEDLFYTADYQWSNQ